MGEFALAVVAEGERVERDAGRGRVERQRMRLEAGIFSYVVHPLAGQLDIGAAARVGLDVDAVRIGRYRIAVLRDVERAGCGVV